VDELSLGEEDRTAFLCRHEAIQRYLAGASLNSIKAATGISGTVLYRQLARALTVHPDGRIWGMRALIPRVRVSGAPYGAQSGRTDMDARAGAFARLLRNHPELDQLIRAYVLKLAAAGPIQESRIPIFALRTRFLQACRKLGLGSRHAYPFNTQTLGYVSLARYVRRLLAQPSLRAAYIGHGEAGARKFRTGDGRHRPVFAVYERVECDAHRIDAVFCVLVPDGDGGVVPCVLPRLWVIVIQDVASRAVLGYYLSLNAECNDTDLLKAIQAALSPWQPSPLTGSQLTYRQGAGMPSALGQTYTGVCWDEFSVDGAKINFSQRVQARLDRVVGARVIRLPRCLPDDRPYVERLFRTLEEGGFHRLPNTTGSCASDIRREHPEVAACKYFIELEDLRRFLDVLIANYNGCPHSSLGGRTPLEYLQWGVRQRETVRPLRYAVAQDIKRLRAVRAEVTVRGGAGRRPFVTFQNANYSTEAFNHVSGLIGEKLIIECDPDDARMVFAYRTTGEEVGPLMVLPPWNRFPHSLLARKLVAARTRTRRWRAQDMGDPTMALLEDMGPRSIKRKAVTNTFLQLRQEYLDRQQAARDEAEMADAVGARDEFLPGPETASNLRPTHPHDHDASGAAVSNRDSRPLGQLLRDARTTLPPPRMTLRG
jgi:hypothetical protein